MAQLSEQAHISMYHFSRLFMIYTGPSPADVDKSSTKIKVLDLGTTRDEWDKSRK